MFRKINRNRRVVLNSYNTCVYIEDILIRNKIHILGSLDQIHLFKVKNIPIH